MFSFSVPILESLIEQGWCEYISSLLEIPEHDSREKVLNAMTVLMDSCQQNFSKSYKSLYKLKSEYEQLSIEEENEVGGDKYFSNLLQTVSSVISKLPIKDEL